MPDGIHHDNVWKVGWAVIGPTSLYAMSIDPAIGIGMMGGYVLGRYLNPDADLVGISYAEGMAMRHFKVLGWIWVGYWTFYGGMFKEMHRSFWTHFPFVSTAIRMAYLLWPLALISFHPQPYHLPMLFGVYLSLSVSDMSHYISDKYFSNSHYILRNSSRNQSNIGKNKKLLGVKRK